MFGHAVTCLLLVSFTLAQTALLVWGETPQEQELKETKNLTIERVMKTVTSTVYHTVKVYPTCTTTVAGVSACIPGDVDPNILSLLKSSQSASHSRVTSMSNLQTSSYDVVEMVLPSCDCGATEGRQPRLLNHQLITLRSLVSSTVDVITSITDQSTTVSITYNGCVPLDAVVTTPCVLL
nr:uncharacterized protein LOC128694781 [Cherax quadricarinatus]